MLTRRTVDVLGIFGIAGEVLILSVCDSMERVDRVHFIFADAPIEDFASAEILIEIPRALPSNDGDRQRPVLCADVERDLVIRLFD